MGAYHKDAALHAKQKNQKLASENQQLTAQLEAAEKEKAEHLAILNSMHEELGRKSQAIAELQQHEGQMAAQFIGDQAKLQELVRSFHVFPEFLLTLHKYEQCNKMLLQLLESQKLLMKRNEDVERLNRRLVSNQVHAYQVYTELIFSCSLW